MLLEHSDSAIKDCNQALKLSPIVPEAFFVRALALVRCGKTMSADDANQAANLYRVERNLERHSQCLELLKQIHQPVWEWQMWMDEELR